LQRILPSEIKREIKSVKELFEIPLSLLSMKIINKKEVETSVRTFEI